MFGMAYAECLRLELLMCARFCTKPTSHETKNENSPAIRLRLIR
jgi:hypothetical protein